VRRPTREQLAALIDHTLLKPEATPADVAALVAEAAKLGVYAVCVSPSMVPVAAQAGGVRVAAVAGFPSGKHVSAVKAQEAAQAVASGASEIDMVVDVGAALAGEIDEVRSDIEAVRAAEDAGADFVKTSTGYHPAGGASLPAVALMAETVGGRLGVKASGGIRTAADAVAMLDAGATRLGLSATRAVLDGLGHER
jgi:deoxyribose-phosphate aldolase